MFRLTATAFKFLPSLFYAYFSWMRKYSNHPERYSLEERFGKVQELTKKYVKKSGIKFDTSGIEKMYDGDKKQMFICNHQSMFDPVLFVYFAKRPLTFVSKIEVKKYPFAGRFVKIIDGLFIDRDNLKQNVKVIMQVQNMLKEGKCDVVIFPEGTRSDDLTKILPFHPGTFRVPFKANCDLVAMETYGTNRCFQFLKYRSKKQLYVQFDFIKRYKADELSNFNSVTLSENAHKLVSEKILELHKKDEDYKKSI